MGVPLTIGISSKGYAIYVILFFLKTNSSVPLIISIPSH